MRRRLPCLTLTIPGAGSLRAQIAAASPGDTINFAGIAANSTITLTTGQISFVGGTNLTFDASANNTVTIAAGAGSRVFRMPNIGNQTITLINLVITGGSLSASGSTGGGISFESGGSLTLTNCTISGNTISGINSFGAGLYMANAGGTLTITGSTISGNSITAINGQGGGLWMGSNTTMVNSTVSGNTTNANNGDGAGIWVNTSVSALSFNHVTIAFNSSTGNGNNNGGGLSGPGFATGSIRNTIIANNTSTGPGPDVSGVFTSDGYNLIGNGTGSTGFTNGVNGDQVGTAGTPIDPLLTALANNGGVTRTHAFASGSPAHDKGKAFGGVTTDQRGDPRPIDNISVPNAVGGNGSDIGAFERSLAPSAAGVGVAGRVRTADGMGLGRVVVSVTGSGLDVPRFAVTNPFGYYFIDDLDAGATYVVTVNSKLYGFAQPSRVVTLGYAITDFDFIAETPPPTLRRVMRGR